MEGGDTQMACNGNNHSPDCNCGWGGDTGGGGWTQTSSKVISRTVSSPVPHVANGLGWNREQNPTLNTYTDPNAKCPVCGADVFFYQSPDDGRVFFDELGPPWPKHPCTDNESYSTQTYYVVKPAGPPSSTPPMPSWEQNGWIPLIVTTVKTEGGHYHFL